MFKPKKLIISGVLITCALTLPYAKSLSGGAGGTKTDISMGEVVGTTISNTRYTVRTYDEKIAVFIEDSSEPVEILDVYLFSLPPADAQILEDGITVYGEENLARVIEDYTS